MNINFEKSLVEALKIYEAEQAEKSVKSNIVENPSTVDLMSVKESDLNWKKIAKLTPEQFENIFKDKTIVLYLPVTFIGNMGSGTFVSYAKGKNRNGNYHHGDNDCTIVFITNIEKGKCRVYDVQWNRHLWTNQHKQNVNWIGDSGEEEINIDKITTSLKGLGLKAFNPGKFSPKVFVVDAKTVTNYRNNKDGIYINDFFKPYMDIIEDHMKSYFEMLDSIKKMVSKYRQVSDVHTLRKGSTWNYVVFNDGKYDLGLVGYAKAITLTREYQEAPVLNFPHSVSTSFWGHNKYAGTDKVPCYKITSAIYDKIAKLIEERWKELKKMHSKSGEFINKWISKFVLGEPVDFDELAKKNEISIEKEGEAKPETNNDPESGSEKVKTSKKALAAAEEKMDLWHEGKRKQNLANCSDAKLKMNYQICKDKGYDKEASQIETEAKKRGISLNESMNESLLDIATE